MPKWADYCITAIKYNSTGRHIESVEVREDEGEKLVNPKIWSRESVISSLESGKTFVTATYKDKAWHKGEDVRIIRVNGVKYLRTDGNYTSEDNLGKLPRL